VESGDFDIAGPDGFRDEDAHAADGEEEPGFSAVDNVYTTLPVLWRAYEETGRERFRDVALSHADRHLDWFVRPDGSTWHHATFDATTGDLRTRDNALGAGETTCWARGLGWHVAGLSRAYRETGASRYLDALERSVSYYRSKVPPDLVPHWDFEVDASASTPRDTSAAALVAHGLCGLPDAAETARLRATGEAILDGLVSEYLLTDVADDRRGLVTDGCYNKPAEYATNNALVWTQYYVAVTLQSLTGPCKPNGRPRRV
jgi:unsaturated chondroitin disaccharide hydrolase